MNATEHIVECYFRYCRKCFTMADVKVIKGNNRQFDLLAYDFQQDEQYHVETSVAHQEHWSPSLPQLSEILEEKFLGVPKKRDGKNTDHAKGKSYRDAIALTYDSVGFHSRTVKRIFVTWQTKSIKGLDAFITNFKLKHWASRSIDLQIWSFRDEILPALQKEIGTSNYSDEVLRTISLIRQMEIQNRPKKTTSKS